MITKTLRLLLLFCIVVLFTPGSCTVTSANNFPLSMEDSGDVGNTLNKAGDTWLFGMFIKNIGTTPITITRAALNDAKNMTAKEISLIKIDGGHTPVGLARWPLGADAPISAAYIDARIGAQGAVLEPGDSYNLLMIVESQADNASASGLIIEYRDAHQNQYVQKSTLAYFLSNDSLTSSPSPVQ